MLTLRNASSAQGIAGEEKRDRPGAMSCPPPATTAGRGRCPQGGAQRHALPDAPGEVLADSAYRGVHFREAVRAKRDTPRIAMTSM
jgi:hypothetical protein